MTLNRYIAASLLSHVLFIAFLGLTSFNSGRIPQVFDVDIVSPPDNGKVAPAKPLPQPPASVHVPRVQKHPSDNKLMPETLYGEGAGAVPGRRDGNNVPGGHEEPRYHDGNTAEKGLPPAETDEKGTVPGKEKPSIAPPTALFDEKTIEKFALKESPLDKGLTFDTSEFKHRGYMKMLKEKIESMWQYPKEAARLGLSGDLYIKFSIRKDGRLADVELLRTSGYRELDEAAIKALKDSAPYWPLPSDWEKDTLEIKGHFIYVYGSSYVM